MVFHACFFNFIAIFDVEQSLLDIDRLEPAWALILCVFGRFWFYNSDSVIQDMSISTSDLVVDVAAL